MTPHEFDAAIFDMDGVITQTATLHARAWKRTFDPCLERRQAREGKPQPPFDLDADYRLYVDGKPRHEGVRSFLAARGIELPEGDPADGPEAETVHGLGGRKDALFMAQVRRDGVEVFASTIELIHALRGRGVKTGVVTSSRNGHEVLRAAGIEALFDMRLDALAAHGADLVVADLRELDLADLEARLREKRETLIAWQIEQEGFDPAREHDMESLFTVGNGYLGVRGTPDTPGPGSQGDLFIAGVYDRKHPERPYSELEFLAAGRGDYPYSELVSAPFPFRLRLGLDGRPLDLAGPHWRAHRRVLDLRRGILHGHGVYETEGDRRTVVRTRRCASLADLHLLLQEVTVCPENHSGAVDLDFSLADPDLAANHPHLLPLEGGQTDPALDVQRFITRASGLEICLAARTTLLGSGRDAVRWRVPGAIGQTLTFRRYVAIYTSRDLADPCAAATERVRALGWEEFEDALAAHAARWGEIWGRADVRIPGSPASAQALRFNAYHLVSAADRDPRVSVGARALTGRAYEGHVFWDVEIFKLPFYLHTLPEVARSLLLYRHHTLEGARRRARELGGRGACYAWESTVTGDDVTPRTIQLKTTGKEIPMFTGTQQVHVTAGVPHGVWRYWEATGDREFLRDAGVEILAETARFWASRCTRGARHYHLRGVVGPDEYHHSVDDNAYTNWMARFNLEQAVRAAGWLQHEFPQAWGALAGRPGAAAVPAYLAMLNGLVVLFNLIPAFPLDGGRILRAALWRHWGDLPRATRAAAGAGRFFAYFLIVTGIFGMLAGHPAGALWRVFIGLFLLMAAQSAASQVWLKEAVSGLHVRDLMVPDPVVRNDHVVGLLELAQVRAVSAEERDQVSVQAVALPADASVRTTPEADALEAMQQMLQAGRGRLLVFEGDAFRGLLTHTGVARLIQIKMALGV